MPTYRVKGKKIKKRRLIMKNQKTLRILALAAALLASVVMLASCSSASKNGMAMEDADMVLKDQVENSGSTIPSYNEKGEMADSATGTENNAEFAPKIIRTANLTAETQNFTDAIAEIENDVKALGGYIESCNIQNLNKGYNNSSAAVRNASYVLRIPAEKLDDFLAEAGELLNVTSSSSNAEDVSGEYYDMEARISVLETERQLVEKMLSEATTINNMITLEERLYEIIYEIESYKTAIKVYDSKVAYSTVNLTVREVANLTPVVEDTSFGARFKNAAMESWQNLVEFTQELVRVLVYVAPAVIIIGAVAVALGVVALIVVAVVKKRVRKARADKK